MIVIRKCNRLGRITVMCTTSYDTNIVAPFMPNLFKDHVICYITKISTHNYNVKNVRHLSSDNSVNSIQDFQHKVIMLNKGINNDNVNINMLTTIIEDLENHDCHMSQTLSLMLLRCCGNVLYAESPKKRQALVDHVWNLVKKRGKLTINHYNALLQAYIDNDHVIDPNEFLKNMTVTPEYNTYCLLLKVPTMGNCTFADDLLSNIEQSSLSIGRKIWDPLMYTYAASGDTDGVMKVVQLMEKGNIAPLYESNIYLMYGYAKRGDIEALDKSLKNALLHPLHIMKLVKCLSLSGHGAYIPNVLSRMEPLTTGKDVVPVIIQLLHTGHVSDVCTVVSHVLDDSEFQNTKKSLIYCVLQEVINLYEDSKTILEVVNNLATKNPAIDIWKQAIVLAIKENKHALALAVLHKMKATDTLIESHHFWPLFLNTQKSDSGPDTYSVLKHMVALRVIIDPKTLENYVFSSIDASDPGAVIIKMKEYGIAPIHSVEPFVTFLLKMGRLKESIILCTTFKKKIDCQKILDPLINNYMKSKDIDSCIHLLYQLCYNGLGFSGIFIKKLVDKCQFKENNGEDLVKLLTAARDYNAVVSDTDAIYIITKCDMSFYGQQKEVVSKLILYIAAGNARQNYSTGLRIHPQFMNTEQLREHLGELRNKNKNVRGALRKLFMKYCNTNNAKLVQELVSEVERNNMTWTCGMRITLFDFYVKTKMIETARSVLRHVLLHFPNFQIDNFKILRFVILLVENKKLSEAFDILKECTSVNQKPDAHIQIHELFNLLIKNNYSHYLEDMINLLAAKGYCSEKYMFRYLILAHMLNGNILTAVSIFENCVNDYNKTPAKQELLIELMKLSLESSSQYDNLLKKVSQLIVEVHGENVANVNIAIALALCNKISELQRLLQTKSVKEELLIQQLNFLKDEEIIATALGILEAISDQTCINVESMCQLTLSLYDKQANWKDAIELKEKMDLKGVRSSATFDKAFNSLLRTHKFQGFSDTVTNEVESNVNQIQMINK